MLLIIAILKDYTLFCADAPNRKPPPKVINAVTTFMLVSGIVPVSKAISGATTTIEAVILATGLSVRNDMMIIYPLGI